MLATEYRPIALKRQLLKANLDDEVVVYDVRGRRAHCLSRLVALVWECCDGKNTVTDILAILRKQLHPAINEQGVWLSLKKLSRARLLHGMANGPAVDPRVRRQLLKALTLIGGVTIATIAVPIPSAALLSCVPCGAPCTGLIPCCPGCTCKGLVCA